MKSVGDSLPPSEAGDTLNGVDDLVDSDDSSLDPQDTDMELYHLYVQLASGAGKVHKPSHANDGVPKCGSHGTRFADLQIGHDWGLNYQLCAKCFGRLEKEGDCPLLCDYTETADGGELVRCGRRCQGDRVQGHLLPSEPGFSSTARHRCSLHSEVVQDSDI